ncbi:charged multivesicular body protein 6-A [Cimex lectularius]|uniref:Charged multivesicular body protein 6 n=1 Tax=Cimex lectularius TaxID=79782 RepID=A0A8I6TDA6_CIMLE|nr:charged multivesicular body protein 6-A [Cimex lectularius]
MGNFFGRSKKVSRVTEHDKAVLQVKQQRDKLKQYQKRIENKLESERLIAKKLLNSGQRERAKLMLKKKRYQENLLAKTDGQLENLENLIHDLEFSQVELRVLDGLKVGNEALKSLNALLNIDEIERIMDETNEGYEKQQEINEILSGKLSNDDMEDIEKEFNELMVLEDSEKEKSMILPDVPIHEPNLPAEKIKPSPIKEKPKKMAMEAS